MKIEIDDGLILRSLTTADARAMITRINENREYLGKWLPWVDSTRTAADTAKAVLQWQAQEKDGSDCNLGIFTYGKYIGNIGVMRINRLNLSAMLGYWISRADQGQGVITRSARALINHCFEELRLNRVYIMCAQENEKSRAIPERLGFIQEGVLRQAEIINGCFHNMVVYGMIRQDWEDRE